MTYLAFVGFCNDGFNNIFIVKEKVSTLVSDSTNDEVDYSDSKCWFEANQEGMNKKVDIFYVVPTCIWDYTDIWCNNCRLCTFRNTWIYLIRVKSNT